MKRGNVGQPRPNLVSEERESAVRTARHKKRVQKMKRGNVSPVSPEDKGSDDE